MFMDHKYPIITYKDEDWIFIAECPTLPWFHTYGYTIEELNKNIDEALELYIETIKDQKIKEHKLDFIWLSFIQPQTA